MHGTGGALKDEGIGEFDVPGIAVRLYTDTARDGGDGPDGRTQRDGRHLADASEIAERTHRCLISFGNLSQPGDLESEPAKFLRPSQRREIFVE
jgi:hypothetical protein